MNTVLLVWQFPENLDESCTIYMPTETSLAVKDAVHFLDMYPGATHIEVIQVREDGAETKVWTWNNPDPSLQRRLPNSAGLALKPSLTTSASAPTAGLDYQSKTPKSTISLLHARPPLEGQFASPLPDTSKVYGGRRGRRMSRVRR